MTAGLLYTVATPIGNLGDMTVRAVSVLTSADLIACEDTRETRKLLDHYGVEAGDRLLSYHAQSRDSREDELVAALQEGKNVALVSDRGTPGISDPGSRLIVRAVELGITVVPIPGPSALVAALQAAGVSTSSFLYLGFMPHKKGRQTLLQEVASEKRTIVFYESPHRILKTLEALKDCGRRIVLARELTKMHEEFIRGTAAQVLAELQSRDKILGEFVVIVHD
ncbi:MAG: 16S rRNA (cytidine(1402)-2'-O)-methyltransferase [Candidatus Kerfeldbacteria bacterium]